LICASISRRLLSGICFTCFLALCHALLLRVGRVLCAVCCVLRAGITLGIAPAWNQVGSLYLYVAGPGSQGL
jgi:hypothetical protein